MPTGHLQTCGWLFDFWPSEEAGIDNGCYGNQKIDPRAPWIICKDDDRKAPAR